MNWNPAWKQVDGNCNKQHADEAQNKSDIRVDEKGNSLPFKGNFLLIFQSMENISSAYIFSHSAECYMKREEQWAGEKTTLQ